MNVHKIINQKFSQLCPFKMKGKKISYIFISKRSISKCDTWYSSNKLKECGYGVTDKIYWVSDKKI